MEAIEEFAWERNGVYGNKVYVNGKQINIEGVSKITFEIEAGTSPKIAIEYCRGWISKEE